MAVVPERSRPSPESKKFEKENFPAGTDILFFDDKSKKWKAGTVDAWADPVKDSEGNLYASVATYDAGVQNLKLSLPPKKIDKIPSKFVDININGKNYRPAEVVVVKDSGEVEMTLINVADAKDRIENINLKTIKNLEAVEAFETDIEGKIAKLKLDAVNTADSRVKKILIGLVGVEKKVKEAAEKLGVLSEWHEVGQAEADQIGLNIKQLQAEIKVALSKLEEELKGVEKRKGGTETLADEAVGLQKRLDREVLRETKKSAEAHKTEVESAKTVHDAWKKDKAEWDKKKKAKDDWDKLADKKGKADPGDPGVEPKEPPKPESVKETGLDQAKIDATYTLFMSIKGDASITDKHKEIIKKVQEQADKQAKQEGFVGYAGYDADTQKEVIAEIFQKVLNEEKGVVAVEGEKFDLDAEKGELKNKIKEIMARAKAVGMPMPGGQTVEQVTSDWLDDINIIPASPRPQADQERDILNQWDLVRRQEVRVYEAELKKIPTPERPEQEENDIDVPDTVLRELFADRPKEVRSVLEIIYNEKLKATDEQQTNFEDNESVMEAMAKLMNKKPSKDVLDKLRQYGIKNWEQFQTVWKKKMAKKAAGVLHQWGQADLQAEMSKQIGAWDTAKALKWQLGARIAVNVIAVTGGAMLATSIIATGGAAGVALAAAGGAAGGGIRALLQKFGFGSKTMEDRKKKALEEMCENKRKEIIKNTLDKKFGASGSGTGGLNAETSAIFSSIMAEAIRVASDEMVKGDVGDFSNTETQALVGDSKRLYIQALKNAREAGLDISPEQKVSMAIALESLVKRGGMKNAEAVKASDPLVVKMLDGVMAGYSGQMASRENYGVSGTVATVAIGATVGAAFFSNSMIARGVLGGLGGATAGYKMGEGMRVKREVKKASETFLPRFNTVNAQWEKYSNDAGSFTADELKNFGDEIKNFNRYIKGEADTVAEQKIVELIKQNPQLRKQIENVVYQAYRRGVFARIGLAEMKKHAEEKEKESKIKLADTTKTWLAKTGWRVGSVLAGATVGAGLAVAAGYGVQELREHYGVGQPAVPDTTRKTTDFNPWAERGAVAANTAAHNNDLQSVGEWHAPGVIEHAPDVPAHPAGLIEAPTKVSGIDDWRHQIMEKMGYKFHGGKIDHALRFHPGAKIALMHHDGTPVLDAKGHVVDYTFKKGGSTSDALDHLQSKANGLLKAGEVPTIKIEGADTGKVEVLDHYKVESHIGGKTQMVETVEPVAKSEVPTVRNVGPNEFKQGGWASQKEIATMDYTDAKGARHTIATDPENVDARMRTIDDTHGKFFGRSGKVYEPVYGKGEEDPFAFKDDKGNLFDSKTGEYFTTAGSKHVGVHHTLSAEHTPPQTKWSSGGAVSNRSGLETMLKGTTPGGPAAEAAPQAGGDKGGAATEVVKTFDAKAGEVVKPVEGKVVAPTAEAKVGAPVVPEAKAGLPDVPAAFKGHESQYQALQNMENNAVNDFNKIDINLAHDKAGVMDHLLKRLDTVFSRSPKLLDDPLIKDALTSPGFADNVRLIKILDALGDANHLKLSSAEHVLLGIKGDDIEVLNNVSHNGQIVDVMVAKNGSHAVRYENVKTHDVEVVTNSKTIFNPNNFESKGFKGSINRVEPQPMK